MPLWTTHDYVSTTITSDPHSQQHRPCGPIRNRLPTPDPDMVKMGPVVGLRRQRWRWSDKTDDNERCLLEACLFHEWSFVSGEPCPQVMMTWPTTTEWRPCGTPELPASWKPIKHPDIVNIYYRDTPRNSIYLDLAASDVFPRNLGF